MWLWLIKICDYDKCHYFVCLRCIFPINMPLLLPASLGAYRMSQFAITLETHTYQTEAFSNSQNYLSLFSPMNHEGCMWAIRNWVLNRSTVFFLHSTTCRRWQIANWIYEEALLTLLHNYRNAMPLVFKNRAQHFIQICTRFSAWMMSEKLCHFFKATAVLLLCRYIHILNVVDDWFYLAEINKWDVMFCIT